MNVVLIPSPQTVLLLDFPPLPLGLMLLVGIFLVAVRIVVAKCWEKSVLEALERNKKIAWVITIMAKLTALLKFKNGN